MQTFSLWNADGLKKTIDLGSNWRSPLSSFTDVLFIMAVYKETAFCVIFKKNIFNQNNAQWTKWENGKHHRFT